MKSGNFAFLDICQYLPPGYNLDAYIKAFNPGGLKKSVFPYEYMDSYEKLSSDINLLERKHFYSSLKNAGITDEEWNEFNNNKVLYGWKTLRDLLKFYNNLDVKPFLEAIINNQKFFYPFNQLFYLLHLILQLNPITQICFLHRCLLKQCSFLHILLHL